MTRPTRWQIAAAVAVLIVLAVLVWIGLRAKPAEPGPPPASALVTVASVRAATIPQTVRAFGVIAGSPAASRTLSAARAVIVERLLVSPGQPVAAGAPLIVLANTPASELAFRQAADAVTYARDDLARVQRLYDQRLAANDQLAAARKTLADARASQAAQVDAGAGQAAQTLTAPFAGVVGAAPAGLGEHVAADAPLISLVASGGLVAQLGVEPPLAARLVSGQAAMIRSAVDPTSTFAGRVAIVGRAVDPTSRLVTVTVAIREAGLPLGAAVEGAITVASHGGLLVPRAAVVFDERGAHVFVVRGGKAHQLAVTLGADQGDEVEIGGAARAGDQVAVQGAYQLTDGLAVRTARP